MKIANLYPAGYKLRPSTYYSVVVSVTDTNIPFQAVLYTGFLGDDGHPEAYSALYTGGPDAVVSDLAHVQILERVKMVQFKTLKNAPWWIK